MHNRSDVASACLSHETARPSGQIGAEINLFDMNCLMRLVLLAGWVGLVGSAPAEILVSTNSVWKYLDDGSDQGTAWRNLGFDDSAWAQGPARLGYGGDGEATVVSYGPDENNKHITTYFRRTFNVTDVTMYERLVVRLVRDDGAVVYLNGTEVFRSNLPAEPAEITFATFASSAISGAGEYTPVVSPPLDLYLLFNGENVVAVEVHQNVGTSSDLGFDLELRAFVFGENTPPTSASCSLSN
jgi:hypothetical protein